MFKLVFMMETWQEFGTLSSIHLAMDMMQCFYLFFWEKWIWCNVGIYVSLLLFCQEIIILEMTDFSMLMDNSGCKGTILWEELLGEFVIEIIFRNNLYNS